MRWILRLSPYNSEVIYRPGKLSILADAVSRYPVENTQEPVQNLNVMPLFFTSFLSTTEIQKADSFCGPIIEILKNSQSHGHRTRAMFCVLKGEILYRKVVRDGRSVLILVVPRNLLGVLLKEAHDSIFGGHLGISCA